MKKKFTLEIKSPCQENFNNMIPNSKGSFCDSCAKNVIDLSTKTNSEVALFISENKNKSICARLRTSQLEEEFETNEISKSNNFKYAIAVAASVLLTTNVVGQEKQPVKTEINCPKPNPHVVGKIAYQDTKAVSITIKGKILEKNTKKPLSNKNYPNLTISISGLNSSVKINPKTGEYQTPALLTNKSQEIHVTISSDSHSLSKTIKIDLNKIKNKELILNISIDSETEMQNYQILGGLGINYIDIKKSDKIS